MLKTRLRSCALLGLALCIAGPSAGGDPIAPVDGAIVGYSPGGIMSLVGEGLVECVRREFPGSSLTYEPGNPAGGIADIAAGKRSFALVSPVEAALALAGKPPFSKRYSEEEVYAVARVVSGLKFHFYARRAFLEEYRIASFKDIAEKKPPLRVSTNTKGNLIAQQVAQEIFRAHGISYEDIEQWGGRVFYLPIQQTHDLMRDGRLDLYMTAAFPPSSRLLELASSTPVGFVRLDDVVMDGIAERLNLETSEIAGGTYPFEDRAVRTLTAPILLAAGGHAGIAAYQVANAVYNNFDYYRALHLTFENFSRQMLPCVSPLRIHPEAARFYAEVGVLPESCNSVPRQ